jgi:hypothetical protein
MMKLFEFGFVIMASKIYEELNNLHIFIGGYPVFGPAVIFKK